MEYVDYEEVTTHKPSLHFKEVCQWQLRCSA